MTAALFNRTGFNRRAARVLPQYFTPEYHPWWPIVTIALFLTGVVLAMFTGLFVAVGGTLALKFVGFPLGIFAVLILWLLPDVSKVANPPFEKLIVTYLVLMAFWPSYIAIVIPGLPWMTPQRIVLGVMLLMMLTHMPQYAETRRKIWALLSYDQHATRMYLVYLALAVLVLPLGRDPLDSLTYGVLQETLSLAPVVAAAWVMSDPEKVLRINRVIVVCGIYTMVVAVVENHMQVPPWANYIPSFMQIDPNALEGILSPQARVGDYRYRIRSVFPIVLYYTMYLNLLLPLIIYAAWQMRRRYTFVAIALVPLVLHTIWFANARTAFIPLFTSLLGITGLAIVRTMFFRKGGDHLNKVLMVGGLVFAVAIVGGALAGSHRLQMYTFGGGQHAASNDTRDQQWNNAWRQLAKNPIGTGLGSSPLLVGTYNSKSSNPIIDSLWINQLVDVGFAGFACFFGFFLRSAWIGIRVYMRSDNETEDQAGIMALAVLNFVICSSVVSFNDNNYLSTLLAVGIFALARRQDQRLGLDRRLALPSGMPGTALATR